MYYLKSFYTSSPFISIKLDKNNHNFFQYISNDNKILSFPTYYDKDKINGNIELKLNNNKSILLESLTLSLIGLLQNKNGEISEKIFEDQIQIIDGNNSQNIINEITNFKFCFEPKSKPYETYISNFISIKYFLISIANIKINDNMSKLENKIDICCLKPAPKQIIDEYYLNKDNNKSLNINIGVENVIHVNIKLLKTNYCLDDIIMGKIKIVKSELTLNSIFLEIKREEKINIGNTNLANCQEMGKYELIEGYPEEGDEFYFRYYLNGVKNLTPSYNNKDEKDKIFEVRYFLTFEFNDNTGYQFFKNIEIGIYRMNLNNTNIKYDIKEKNDKINEDKFISIKNLLENK